MGTELKAKTFFAALREFHDHPQKTRKYFKDNRLTQAEKKILECWYFLRDGLQEDIVEQLEKMSPVSDDLVESQRNLILGLAYNNQGRFLKAMEKIEKSVEVLRRTDLHYYFYIAQSNLFNVHFNLKSKVGMKRSLKELSRIGAENRRQELQFRLFKMNYFSFCGRYHFAEKQMHLVENCFAQVNESISVNFVVAKFSHYVRKNDLTAAGKILVEMKKFRKFHFNSNFKFMKMMLDHLVSDKPLYVYQNDFDGNSLLYLQIKITQLLEEGKDQEAIPYWKQLQEMQPGVYEHPFRYRGDRCLFSIALESHQKKVAIGNFKNHSDMPKEKWLYTVLQEIDQPIRKEELFRLIWDRNEESKEDLNKLKVLISRTREKYKIEISYKKGCYQLIRAGSSKIAI